jgi:hypothetical protein
VSIPAVVKLAAKMATQAVLDAIVSVFKIAPMKRPPPVQGVPMTYKGNEHVQGQIRSATTGVNRMPPPRKPRS